MIDDLIAYLRARLDEREAVALAAQGTTRGIWKQTDPDRAPGRIEDDYRDVVTYDEGSPDEAQGRHIADNDPAFVLADVAAKRRIVERYERFALHGGPASTDIMPFPPPLGSPERTEADTRSEMLAIGARAVLADVLLELVQPYAHRQDFRKEWHR